jgi:HlyD family secretion protein
MPRKTTLRWAIIGALALAAVAILGFLFWPRPLAVDIAPVARGAIAETVSDQGVARVRQAYVVSAPVGGRLERLPLEVGDRVVAGVTVVARLRPSAAEPLDPRARAQAQAAIQAAGSALNAATAERGRLAAEARRAELELNRQTSLSRQGFSPRQTLENAQAAAAAARAAVRAADANVHARQAELSSARSALTGPEAQGAQVVEVRSPASGVVTRLMQQSERPVAAGAQLVEIGDTDGLEASIEFLSQDAVKIRPGQTAEIYDWGGQGVIPAEVRRVEPQGFTKISALGVEEQRVLVMLQFTAPPEAWKGLASGYRLWGRVFLRKTPDAVVAPLGALVRSGGGWAVFRVENGKARLRPVTVGAMDERQAEVRGGLAPGDRLVLYPSDQVRDDVAVTPRRL